MRKTTLLILSASALIAGCTTAPLVPGQPGDGERFSGTVKGLVRDGDLTISSNRGRTCWGSYKYSNPRGKGIFRCDDGQFGPFKFDVPGSGRTATGTVTLDGKPYPFTIRY